MDINQSESKLNEGKIWKDRIKLKIYSPPFIQAVLK